MRKPPPAPPEPSDDLQNAYELGYFTAMVRIRRALPTVWRNAALVSLAGVTRVNQNLDETTASRRYLPSIRGFKIILQRCESAATMLEWRRDLTPKQREKLEDAIRRLDAAASRLRIVPHRAGE